MLVLYTILLNAYHHKILLNAYHHNILLNAYHHNTFTQRLSSQKFTQRSSSHKFTHLRGYPIRRCDKNVFFSYRLAYLTRMFCFFIQASIFDKDGLFHTSYYIWQEWFVSYMLLYLARMFFFIQATIFDKKVLFHTG